MTKAKSATALKCMCSMHRGAMIFTFYKAQGWSVGNSMVEDAHLDLAKALVKNAAEKGVKLLLPTDVVVADKYDADAQTRTVAADKIPDDWMVGGLAIDCHCILRAGQTGVEISDMALLARSGA